jgi:hypothetical protein
MGIVKVLVDVDKSEAVKISNNNFGQRSIDIDLDQLTPDQRDELSRCDVPYSVQEKYKIPVDFYVQQFSDVPPIAIATADNMLMQLDFIRKKRITDEKRIAEQIEKKIVEWIAKTDDQKIGEGYTYNRLKIYGDYELPSSDPRVKAERERLTKIITEKHAEMDRIAAERKLEVEKENAKNAAGKARIEAAKTAQLSEAVLRLGTDLQIERWEEGVMPRREALDLIAADLIKPIIADGISVLPAGLHVAGCQEGTEKRTLTDDEFTIAKRVRALMPGWSYSYWHQETDEDSDCDYEWCNVIRIIKKVGEYDFCFDIILSKSE